CLNFHTLAVPKRICYDGEREWLPDIFSGHCLGNPNTCRIRTPRKAREIRVSGTQAPNHKDDAALIACIRAGDQSAMADLYDRYSGVVYGVALRVLANTTAAEDVVQEVFLQLWRNPQAFNADRGRLAPWLAVIARNRAIDLLRKRPTEEDIDELPISTGVNLEDEASQKLAVDKVRAVLGGLPQGQRK